MNNFYLKKQRQDRGAVLLIAILVASVALAVGMGVYNRTYKELLFGSFWKQTQVAFAAADAGLECILYWDIQDPAPTNYSCFGNSSGVWPTFIVGVPQILSMNVSGACVNVEITKNAAVPNTTIRARGYNVPCASISSGSRVVERGLRIDY